MLASDLTCKYAMPALGCNIGESWVISIFYLLTAGLCVWLCVKIQKSNLSQKRKHPMFWISIAIWNIFMAVIAIFPFNYSKASYEIVSMNANTMFFLIPLSLGILTLCDVYFEYEMPGVRRTQFFKIMFTVFLISFLLIGVVISIVNIDDYDELTMAMSLWHASTDLVTMIFVVTPVTRLMRMLKNKSSAEYRKWHVRVSIIIFICVFVFRILYNFTNWIGYNPIQNYMNNEIEETGRIPATQVRMLHFFMRFLIDFLPALPIISMVYAIPIDTVRLLGEATTFVVSDTGVLD